MLTSLEPVAAIGVEAEQGEDAEAECDKCDIEHRSSPSMSIDRNVLWPP